MKHKSFLLTLILLPLLLQAQNQLFTLEEAILGSGDKLRVERMEGLQWIAGSNEFCYADSLDGEYCLVKQAANMEKKTRIITLDAVNSGLAPYDVAPLKRFPRLKWTGESTAAFSLQGRYFNINVNNTRIDLVNKVTQPAENVNFNRKSGRLAYRRENDLFVKLDKDTEIQVTHDGGDGIANGDPYVARAEFGIHNAIFWAPDGHAVAWYRKDESMVTEYPLMDIRQRPAVSRTIRYPMAGMRSEQVQVRVYHIATGSTTVLQTGEPKDQYLTCVTWTPDGNHILIAHLNRDQNHLRMVMYDPVTGLPEKTLFEEKNAIWIEPQTSPIFLRKSSDRFLWFSKRDGFNNLYLYDLKGKMIRQVTRFRQDVNAVLGIDKLERYVYVAAASEDGLESHAWMVNIKSRRALKITTDPGTHTVTPSHDGTFFIDQFSSHMTPNIVKVIDQKGEVMQTLLKAKNPLLGYALGQVRMVKLNTDDGTLLNGRMFLPHDFDPAKKYPVIVYVYGGPRGQMIQDAWLSGWRFWFYYMAQQGFIVFNLDNRGTNNRGWDFEKTVYRRLGTIEVIDQMAGVDYLKSLPYVDAGRIGVHGWSYGGFMTLSMLTRRPGVFKVGVAGGPVVDWRYYEVMYGERYMDTPMANPEGYEKASLFNYVDDLDSKLLIIHGTVDPVVVMQNSLLYLRKAIDAGKQVDYFVYPGDEHNMRGRDRLHLYQKITDYFKANL